MIMLLTEKAEADAIFADPPTLTIDAMTCMQPGSPAHRRRPARLGHGCELAQSRRENSKPHGEIGGR
jgi:hypothetical protein